MVDAPVTHPAAAGYPSPTFPAVFVDGVLNTSHSGSTVKFYLFRYEPSFQGDNSYQTQPCAQVIMPMEAFVAAAAFFELQAQQLVQKNLILQSRVDEIRALVGVK